MPHILYHVTFCSIKVFFTFFDAFFRDEPYDERSLKKACRRKKLAFYKDIGVYFGAFCNF